MPELNNNTSEMISIYFLYIQFFLLSISIFTNILDLRYEKYHQKFRNDFYIQ